MPILMILLLTAACLPVPWGRLLLPFDATVIATIAVAYVTGSILLSAIGCRLVLRRIPLDRDSAIELYRRLRLWLGFGNIAIAAALVVSGWGWAVRELTSDETGMLAPFAEVMVPAPYLIVLVANWFVWYHAERALHRTGSPRSHVFWSLPGYLLQQARQFTLMIFLPVFLIAGQQSVGRHAPATSESTAFQIASFAGMIALLIGLPLAMKRLLGLKKLPDGAIREQLVATGTRLRFRCADWLLWPTRGLAVNAMIVGFFPHARFVIFTDRLLDAFDPPELDAVVGHEIGHARHGHIPYYLAFFALGSAVMGTAVAALEAIPGWPSSLAGFGILFGVLGFEVYLFLVFGYLSRVCERQADVVGARAASCSDSNCRGHTEETILADGGRSICPTGVRAMVRALDLVMALNGIARPEPGSQRQWLAAWWKSWQHGPPSHRIDFLLSLIERPDRAVRHDRFAFRLRLGLVLMQSALLAAAAWLMGWDEFSKPW